MTCDSMHQFVLKVLDLPAKSHPKPLQYGDEWCVWRATKTHYSCLLHRSLVQLSARTVRAGTMQSASHRVVGGFCFLILCLWNTPFVCSFCGLTCRTLWLQPLKLSNDPDKFIAGGQWAFSSATPSQTPINSQKHSSTSSPNWSLSNMTVYMLCVLLWFSHFFSALCAELSATQEE